MRNSYSAMYFMHTTVNGDLCNEKAAISFHKFALAYPDFTYSPSALYCYSEPSFFIARRAVFRG